MNKNKVQYFILIIIFLIIIFHNNLYININLDKDIKNLYCDNLNRDLEEYDNSLINTNTNIYLSKIKYRDIYNYKHEFTIYKGYNEGVNVGNAVVYNNSLIGIISKTYMHSSIVRLITNKKSNISVQINNLYGILKYDQRLYIDDLVGEVQIEDKVYTSGIGNIIPNVLVGKVKSINKTNNELKTIIEIEPDIDFNKLNYLYIIGDSNA